MSTTHVGERERGGRGKEGGEGGGNKGGKRKRGGVVDGRRVAK